jgi:hypothetical protein
MPRRKPAPSASSHLRRSIAAQAARLMAEDGIDNYGLAKRKAARALGVAESESLPTNEEVEAELRTYLALYQDDEQPERLRQLRQVALEVMNFLADFRPYLTGDVLDGTAGRYADVDIELYADSGKDVEIFLLSHNIPYEPAEFSRHSPDSPEVRLRLDWHDVPVVLSVFPLQAERHSARNPHTGRTRQRARASTVAELLSS